MLDLIVGQLRAQGDSNWNLIIVIPSRNIVLV